MIIRQEIDMAGKIRIVWQHTSGNIHFLKYNVLPSETEIEKQVNELEQLVEFQNEEPVFENDEKKQIVINIVELIKNRPTITPTQFNNYLSTLQWYEQIQYRNFIYDVGVKLAQRNNVDIRNFTEAQVFNYVRDFIVNTPKRKLAKLFINQLDF